MPANGIEKTVVTKQNKDNKVYNMQGLCVGTMDRFNQLPKGVYISGGKKIVRK